LGLSPYVFDATAENFQTLVMENSRRGLVLVHFWTPKAGPCMVLMPRLVKLASDYGGRFLLVMLNTDELGSLARLIGVAIVPTVKFFRNGDVVHTIHGAEPDNTFHEALGKFLATDIQRIHDRGLAAWQQGNQEQARQLLAQAALDDPDNPAIPRDLAKLLWSSGEQEQALTLLRALPPSIRSAPEIESLYSHFMLAYTSQMAPDTHELEARTRSEPDNTAALYQLAARYLAEDQLEPALASLHTILTTQPLWQDRQAEKVMRHLLDWLGHDHPLVGKYRPLLDGMTNQVRS
jgi:putative thioredoxin